LVKVLVPPEKQAPAISGDDKMQKYNKNGGFDYAEVRSFF